MTIPTLAPDQAGPPTPTGATASFWLSQPALVGHRSTPELPRAADVVVVGSGITGAFAAHFLAEGWSCRQAGEDGARAGAAPVASAVMLEAREVCSGATGRNGGHCQPRLTFENPDLSAFELRCFHLVRDLVAEHDIPCDWDVDLGGVNALMTKAITDPRMHFADGFRKRYPDDASAIEFFTDRKDLAELRVACGGGYSAIHQKNAAALWPYKLVTWLLERVLKDHAWRRQRAASGGGSEAFSGFNLQTNTPVLNIQRVELAGGAHTWVVHTARGQIAARQVIIATNGYTSHILPAFTGVITPVQGQVSALIPPAKDLELRHTYGFTGALHPGQPVRDDYLVQRRHKADGSGGELIYGGGRWAGKTKGWGVSDDDFVDPDVETHLETSLPESMDLSGAGTDTKAGALGGCGEGPKRLKVAMSWTGIMGYSRDNFPWVGAVPQSAGGGDGLWLCAGYTGHGMPQAPLCARAIVELASGKPLAEVDLPAEFLLTEERLLGDNSVAKPETTGVVAQTAPVV